MPIPRPEDKESKKEFLERCMGDSVMNKEFPDNKQRYAVCNSAWKKENKSKESDDMDKLEGKDTRNKIERRFSPMNDAEVRVEKEEGKPTKIVGYFAKFNKLSDNLGGFREKIEQGFFKDALGKSDTVDLFNHDPNYILGRVSAGTLKVWEDKEGLKYECVAPDTQLIRDLVLSPIERGDVKGNSFGFRVKGNGDMWEEDENGVMIRTLLKDGCTELIDGSQVVHPAYPDTSLALRSLDDWKEERNKKKQEEEEIERQRQEKEESEKRRVEEEAKRKVIEDNLIAKELKLKEKELIGKEF